MREVEGYRDQLEDILTYFNGKRLLSAAEVARYLGKDRRTVTKWFSIRAEGIAATKLARALAKL